jgi:hypothetical protein
VFMALQAALVAGWALLSPRSFFEDFPVVGGTWVDAFPPYNEHLIRDVGGLYLGFAILFFWAAANMEPGLVRGVLIAWLPFAVLHLWFHVTHLEGLSGAERFLQTTSLILVTVIPFLVLAAQRRSRTSTFGGL